MEYDKKPGQALHDVAVSSKNAFGTTTAPARRSDQVALTQLLMHLGHGDTEQGRDLGQVVDGLAGVNYIVGGRNAAHRTESRSQRPAPEAPGADNPTS